MRLRLRSPAFFLFSNDKFFCRLTAAGIPEDQAEALSEAFREAQSDAELATKPDIELLKRDLKELETKFIGELTLVKWMLGLLFGGVLVLILRAFFPE
jgi:hypothetical protein